MNPQANNFDVYKAEEELKKCPKIVRDYVKLIKKHWENQKQLTALAIKKLRDGERDNNY